jgi:hypothetical protein
MRRALEFKTIGLATLMGVALVAACGDDEDSSTVPTGPSGPTTTTTSTGGSGGSTTSTGGSATGGSGGGQAQTCANYCNLQDANCTVDDDQYGGPGQDWCLATCALWPVGTPADTTGNTLGCRIYHTDTASTVGVQHCSHGGPHGGPADDAHCQDMGEDQCNVFCQTAMAACTGTNEQFGGDLNTCQNECLAFPGFSSIDADYSAASSNQNNFACRFYHLTAAADDPDQHCGHIGTTSATCTMTP